MFERIIVPLDGSRLSVQAIPYASEVGKHFDAEIILVRVISPSGLAIVPQATGMEMMRYYRDNSIIRHGADPREVGIESGGKITVGKFIDVERPTFLDLKDGVMPKVAAGK